VEGGIEPLAKELFTLEVHKFKLFLTTLGDRAMTYGWENVLDVPINAAVPAAPTHSLLSHYGQITLQQSRDNAAIYANAQTWAAQNNLTMYTCLAASIAPETKAKAMIYHQDFHIGQTPSRADYLKILIRKAYVDTRSRIFEFSTPILRM